MDARGQRVSPRPEARLDRRTEPRHRRLLAEPRELLAAPVAGRLHARQRDLSRVRRRRYAVPLLAQPRQRDAGTDAVSRDQERRHELRLLLVAGRGPRAGSGRGSDGRAARLLAERAPRRAAGDERRRHGAGSFRPDPRDRAPGNPRVTGRMAADGGLPARTERGGRRSPALGQRSSPAPAAGSAPRSPPAPRPTAGRAPPSAPGTRASRRAAA